MPIDTVTEATNNAIAEVRHPSQSWSALCLNFVARVYGFSGSGTPPVGKGRAITAWGINPNKVTSGIPPRGALVYWGNSPDGHVAFSLGGGRVISTHKGGIPAVYKISDIRISPYLGWTPPGFAANNFQSPSDYGQPVSDGTNGRDDAFYSAVLAGIGAPITPTNLGVMRAWARAEGGTASFNPFNTTQNAKGSTSYRGGSVKNYKSRQSGIDATIQTLKLGYYKNVVAGFRRANPNNTIAAIVASPWAGGHYNAPKNSQGYNWQESSFWKVWKSIAPTMSDPGNPAATTAPSKLPLGLTSGDGSLGTGQYDPDTGAFIDPQGKIWFPYTLWLAQATPAMRKGTAVIIHPGAYKAAGNLLDPGAVEDQTPFQLAGGVAADTATAGYDAVASALGPISGLFSWVGGNLSRIGLVALGLFVVVIAVVWSNRSTLTKAATVAAVA